MHKVTDRAPWTPPEDRALARLSAAPNDPVTASVKKKITLSHASRLSVSTALNSNDLDLYVLRDANNDGVFSPSEIVASSAGGTANEAVDLVNPPDGNYQIWCTDSRSPVRRRSR